MKIRPGNLKRALLISKYKSNTFQTIIKAKNKKIGSINTTLEFYHILKCCRFANIWKETLQLEQELFNLFTAKLNYKDLCLHLH